MERLKRFSFDDLSNLVEHKTGEIKIGERIQLLPETDNLSQSLLDNNAKYVLLGIPENIGVRAKTGKSSLSTLWDYAVKNVVNLQHNKFCKGNLILLLGFLDFSLELNEASELDLNDKNHRKQYYKLVENLDKEVSHIVFTILKSGKIPILIGGGQNNSYGAIKGAALAYGKQVNAINFDAFSHFTTNEGRHSGNSFSYAFEEGFLKNYFVFGLHENYTSKGVLDNIKTNNKNIRFNTYEEIVIRREKEFKSEMDLALQFIEKEGFGIDIDLDSMTILSQDSLFSSGFQVQDLRRFVDYMSRNRNVSYFHISEGSFVHAEYSDVNQVGKLIAILITDFIKSNHLYLNNQIQ